MNKQQILVQKELGKVIYADLSNYDEKTNTYHIPKVNMIKCDVGGCYLVHIKDSFFNDRLLRSNYNKGSQPTFEVCLIDVLSSLGKLIKVNMAEYDEVNNRILSGKWSGYIARNQLEIVRKL